MNKFCQRVITICVIVMTIFSILAYCKINSISHQLNTIVELDYQDTWNNAVLDNIDLNVIRILDRVANIELASDVWLRS